jgi:hypothetical protein
VKGALLLEHASGDEAQVRAQSSRLAGSLPAVRRLQACIALDQPLAYVYAWIDQMPAEAGRERRLATIAEWRGASAGERASYHYVVATDVDEGWNEELNAWYQQEHMPGLAAVPGNVGCARLRSMDGAPRYYACYDLLSPQVLERPEWLAVRHTEWSSRVRPHFVNTRRLMFRTVLDDS